MGALQTQPASSWATQLPKPLCLSLLLSPDPPQFPFSQTPSSNTAAAPGVMVLGGRATPLPVSCCTWHPLHDFMGHTYMGSIHPHCGASNEKALKRGSMPIL